MVAGTAAVVWLVPRHEARPESPVQEHAYDPQWLTKAAAAQVIGEDGSPGPLFAGVYLGGPTPDATVRARIADFARRNHVAIDLVIADDTVQAIHFDVTFGGCCGYEAADVLALRLQRPHTGWCCVCGGDRWIDDWAITNDAGVYTRARVRVNRVAVRWERALSVPELVERADSLLGADIHALARSSGDRLTQLAGDDYQLEVPYPDAPYGEDLRTRNGLALHAERGRVVEVSTSVRALDDDTSRALAAVLRARRKAGRIAKLDADEGRITLRTR